MLHGINYYLHHNTSSELQRSVMFIETSWVKTLVPSERHIENQLEDCRLKIIRLNTLLIFNFQS